MKKSAYFVAHSPHFLLFWACLVEIAHRCASKTHLYATLDKFTSWHIWISNRETQILFSKQISFTIPQGKQKSLNEIIYSIQKIIQLCLNSLKLCSKWTEIMQICIKLCCFGPEMGAFCAYLVAFSFSLVFRVMSRWVHIVAHRPLI